MAHTNDWDATNEAHPPDTDNVGGGADDIRDLKLDLRERLNVDHYWDPAGTQADHGQHRKVLFQGPLASSPTLNADEGEIYTKDVSAKAELFYTDEDGNDIQITSGGSLSVTTSIPSGTKMLFYQDTAPVGWTIQNTLNDKLVFVTKGSAAGGQTGGGAHSAGTWTRSGSVSGTTGTPTVTKGIDDIPVTTTVAASNHRHSFSGSWSNSSWRPSAYCCIICEKD